MDFDAVADEVYAAGRGDFVPVRDERAKQARASGDRALAERIKGLRKPTVAASLLNRLARAGSDDLDRLGRLGEALRDAHQRLDGDRLRELSRERHDLIGELTARVRSLASEEGLSVNDGTARQLEDSFEAALADERAFRELCLGRLAGALTEENSGQWFTAVSAPPVKSAESAEPAKPAQPKPKSARKPEKPKREKEGADREKKRAEQEAAQQKELAEAREKERAELEAARETAAATVRARDEARQTQADAENVAEDAAEAVADLRKRLKEAERAERAARKEATAARREAESAARAATEADRELRNLRTKSH
jgi:hypothetical protein